MEWIVVCFAFLFLVQITYLLLFQLKFVLFKPEINNNYYPPISVIICAKNEAVNLKKKLPKVLQQRYSNFEVIVIDDHSSDETRQVIESFKDDRVTYVLNDRGTGGAGGRRRKGGIFSPARIWPTC